MTDFSQARVGDVLQLLIDVHDEDDNGISVQSELNMIEVRVKAICILKNDYLTLVLDTDGVILYSPDSHVICVGCHRFSSREKSSSLEGTFSDIHGNNYKAEIKVRNAFILEDK